MATIKIRGRLEPVLLENSIAKKVKERKFGYNGTPKAESNELVDLGDWSGEYGRIIEIDTTTDTNGNKPDKFAEQRKIDHENKERLLARGPAVKGAELGWYLLCYSTRTGDFQWQPDDATRAKVIELQTKYFTSHPRAFTVPSDEYGKLLPPRKKVQTLADKLRVSTEPENIRFDKDPLAF